MPRIDKNTGFKYTYSEDPMTYLGSYDTPCRTMLTSEKTVNHSTHVVKNRLTGNLILLTSIKYKRLNQIPNNWTSNMTLKRKYFIMENALVTYIIKNLVNQLLNILKNWMLRNRSYNSIF